VLPPEPVYNSDDDWSRDIDDSYNINDSYNYSNYNNYNNLVPTTEPSEQSDYLPHDKVKPEGKYYAPVNKDDFALWGNPYVIHFPPFSTGGLFVIFFLMQKRGKTAEN
jgi:hypothetical protein